jgi:hypothetical protein
MTSGATVLVMAACIFGGALLGLVLQGRLPAHHLGKDSHDIVKLGAGMIATLTALVLGLLVSSAKSSFDATSAGLVQVSARFILLDRALARYGPEAAPARAQLRRVVAASIEAVWPEEKTGVSGLTALERGKGVEILQEALGGLTPRTDAQREALSSARQLIADVAQTRWVVIEQAQTPLPTPFLVVLTVWLTVLFVSFGLYAPRNATVVTVLFVCACSMAGAIFLVLEMNRPLEGSIRVSSAPLRKALEHLGR